MGGLDLTNQKMCVSMHSSVCARSIWADGIKFPLAHFTPYSPLMSQVCVCLCGANEVTLCLKVVVLMLSLYIQPVLMCVFGFKTKTGLIREIKHGHTELK